MEGLDTPSKIDLRFAEHKIIFSISDCTLNKKYSFYSLSKEQSKDFLYRIRHLENMTWKQLSGLDRKQGLTVENKNSESFQMIHEQNTSDRKIVETYYFHIRICTNDKFRIFGYQKNQLFFITHIDPEGCIHHS